MKGDIYPEGVKWGTGCRSGGRDEEVNDLQLLKTFVRYWSVVPAG